MSDAFNGRGRRSNKRFPTFLSIMTGLLFVMTLTTSCDGGTGTADPPNNTAGPTPATWEEKVAAIRWVAYYPPLADPRRNISATEQDIREDIAVLRRAGFTGLVTYGSSGTMGRYLPGLARSEGFQGVIVGVGDPTDEDEMALAEAAAELPIVLGVCVGNEGLHQRYEMAELSSAIERLRKSTGKPVTTTEEIDDYSDETLLQLGDWVFPNAHPYFHDQLDPDAAVQWTQAAYEDLARRAGRFVLFKEVGLPTAGDRGEPLSEENQERYYRELMKTDVAFVYFEAYDQPWKTHLPVEPHWGIFRSDRTPKLLAASLLGTASPAPISTGAGVPTSAGGAENPFYVYRDAGLPDNHYAPTGYMGDVGDIHVDEAFEGSPRSGGTSIRAIYDSAGKGPHECPYSPPCRWSGVYWQHPPDNWGKDAPSAGSGFDLSRYDRLLFWARADEPCTVEFKVGGIAEPYGDSLISPRSIRAKLATNWQEFKIDLEEADLTHIIGAFTWVTNWQENSGGITFYLDDIRFEKK